MYAQRETNPGDQDQGPRERFAQTRTKIKALCPHNGQSSKGLLCSAFLWLIQVKTSLSH